MNGHYILDGHEPKAVDLMTWARWFETANRLVAKADLPGDVSVSTVFLGLNHNFSPSGPPLIFETMIFGGEHDQYHERYATWDDAVAGHERAVALASSPAEAEVRS